MFMHHGTPSAGLLVRTPGRARREQGIRLIGFDRAGYGGSTRPPGPAVAAGAGDVEGIADALRLDPLWTWGISGGGPHALACASATAATGLAAAASLAGVAPWDAGGWTGSKEWARRTSSSSAWCSTGEGRFAAVLRAAPERDSSSEPGTAREVLRLAVRRGRPGRPDRRARPDGCSSRRPSGLATASTAGSTTTLRSSSRGGSSSPRFPGRCSCCTATTTASCPSTGLARGAHSRCRGAGSIRRMGT